MCFERLIKTKWKNFKARNSGKKVRKDKLGNDILVKLSYCEFYNLWKPFENSPALLTNFSGDSLVVCRNKDVGHYEIGNVRIDTLSNNSSEANSTKTALERHIDRENARKASDSALSDASKIKRKESFQRVKHQQADKNSQFGTYWITNSILNMKWSYLKGEIPFGYFKGRTIKKHS